MDYVHEKCEACRPGAPEATEGEKKHFLERHAAWSIGDAEGIPQLSRTYTFKNFKQALTFTQKIGDLAEAEDHHPAILTEWGKVTVKWWTHKIRNVHKNDLIMAAKSDVVYEEF